MINLQELRKFYSGKKVLVTGHTGFKGSWLVVLLEELGADVYGYALKPPTEPSLYDMCKLSTGITSIEGDVRDLEKMQAFFEEAQPEIVIHMAAQPLVRESYENPVYTYETNVLGTVNVLECCRHIRSVKSVVNVTTDKVYYNDERNVGFKETDVLDGYDPYSNSKSCSELVTHSYVQSFFNDMDVAVSTCRAGNVIGGGDFAKDRIIPDAIRAFANGEILKVRNPNSIRPYQHVLEPVVSYLVVAMRQYEDKAYAGAYNIGPKQENCVNTRTLAEEMCSQWDGASWESMNDNGPHEANFLKLDCTKIKETFGIESRWNIRETIRTIVEFEKLRINGATAEELKDCMKKQMEEYFK